MNSSIKAVTIDGLFQHINERVITKAEVYDLLEFLDEIDDPNTILSKEELARVNLFCNIFLGSLIVSDIEEKKDEMH